MNKLDTAITSFRLDSIDPSFRSEDQERCAMLADALEEIRDLLTADKQSHTEEQPATFEPWDCVKLKPTSNYGKFWGDTELVLGSQFEDGSWRVFNPDNGDESLGYAEEDELIFVRRLKPREQAEPTNDDLLRAAGYTQKPSFQVGDWVHSFMMCKDLQITSIQKQDDRSIIVTDPQGLTYSLWIKDLEKIDPPAPRFTFGDRVVCDSVTGLFIRYVRSQVGITKETCQFLGLTDNNIHTCYAEELCLLDELPF